MCKQETYCETYYLIVGLTNIRNGGRNSDRNETYKTYSVISQNLLFSFLVWICAYKILVGSYLCLSAVEERKRRNNGVTVDSECIFLIFVVKVEMTIQLIKGNKIKCFLLCAQSFVCMRVWHADFIRTPGIHSAHVFCFIVWNRRSHM